MPGTDGSDGGETETEETASETLDLIASRASSEQDASSRIAEVHNASAAARDVKPARFIRTIVMSLPGTPDPRTVHLT